MAHFGNPISFGSNEVAEGSYVAVTVARTAIVVSIRIPAVALGYARVRRWRLGGRGRRVSGGGWAAGGGRAARGGGAWVVGGGGAWVLGGATTCTGAAVEVVVVDGEALWWEAWDALPALPQAAAARARAPKAARALDSRRPIS